jgi:hypothetical protein
VIHGYPQDPTVTAGDTLVLRVATDAPRFRVDFYRQGEALELAARTEWLAGHRRPLHLPYQDWGVDNTGLQGERLTAWPAYSFPIPDVWPAGVYVAMLVEGDGRGREVTSLDFGTPDARDSKALFVVAPPGGGARSPILYKLPLFTYHAYNRVTPESYNPVTRQGGWSLYTVPRPGDLPRAVPPAVSVRRPGGGTGGTPWDMFNLDPFDPTPRQTFVHWDAPFVGWLERSGYAVDFCTDLDLHRDGDGRLLAGRSLLLCAGHDEYWSEAMRRNVDAFVGGGGNVAFLCGNTCWYHVSFDDDFAFRRLHPWSDPECGNPENALTGVSYRNGGERRATDELRPFGYTVQHADHWIYEGTGLREGETFGDGPHQHLVGYECDGAEFDRSALREGVAARPMGGDGTPLDFVILAVSDVSLGGWGLGNGAATMGLYTRNGTVFTASTTDWVRVVARGLAPEADCITRNVLDRLGRTRTSVEGRRRSSRPGASRPPPRR